MHAIKRLYATAAIGVFASILAAATTVMAQPSATDADLERFRGHWKVVELVEDGRGIAQEQMQQMLAGGGVLEIVDYTILFNSPLNGAKSSKTFRLDATSYPKRIAIMERDTTTGVGIYKFDQDSLVVCVSKQAGASPNDFSAAQGSGRTLIVLKKFRPGTADAPNLQTDISDLQPVAKIKTPPPPAPANNPNAAQPQPNPQPQPQPNPQPQPQPNPQPQPTPQTNAQPAPLPLPNPPKVASGEAARILTDAEVRKMALGTWRVNDTDGSVDIVFDANGKFQTYRYYRRVTNFQDVFVPTPISSGTWSIANGRLVANVTASSRLDKVNQAFVPAVRSISANDMILVDHLGRVSRAVKVR